jgi:hypothetical protein
MLPSYFLPPPSLRTRTLPNLAAVAAVLHHSDLDTVHRLQFPHLPIAGPFRSIYSAVETQFSVVGVVCNISEHRYVHFLGVASQ